MCGIAGIVRLDPGPAPDAQTLTAMARALRHRGPDGTGFFSDERAGLAHTRLSIIDLAGGDQPIHNEDETVWVIFNGEIVNYIELRAELETQGHRFYTHSDTEVLVHLYEQHGLDFVTKLNGQFAIAIYDLASRRVVLCRDRAGILPLFYNEDAGRLLFASEVKALLPAMSRHAQLDPAALDDLFTFWFPAGERTMFDGVRQLRPGQMLVCDGAEYALRNYWHWRFAQPHDYLKGSADALAQQLRELLLDATRLRMRADVPVGAYLSGGLDSSALVALMCATRAKPETFSLRFNDAGLDEGDAQQRVAARLGVKHRDVHCSERDIAAALPRAIWHTETAVLRNAPVPMMLLSGLVHGQGCKVVMTGEGSDEVLGGYDIFKEDKIRRFWAVNARSAWRPLLLKRLYPYLELGQGRAQSYGEAFFGTGLDAPDAPFFSHLPRWNMTAQCKAFFAPDFAARLRERAFDRLARALPDDYASWHAFNRGQYLESRGLMANYLLCSQGDRMLMANSVEGRFPFLDHRVIEFAARLDPRLKMHVLDEKHLLKRAVRNDVPREILQRHKQPYRAPDLPAFFAHGEPAYVAELLGADALARAGYFDAGKVSLLLKKARAGRAPGVKDNMAFVGILSTQIWHYLFVEHRGDRAAVDALAQ
jgi:asparagine synthase (glutamine-hydrolysing)